ncbi:hypothetical protein [Desulfotomaculum sp. 1211_IL3151]|uniref:hypothetical protein n=1 Tax=Desulfotomaculum sp. 1211_IL3151 TaxID=3084055 RepID=UPI002FDA63CC
MTDIAPLNYIAASLLAAGVSWVINGWVINSLGGRGIAFLTPLVEEMAKTLGAVLLGAALVYTHIGFGVVEALVEMKRRGARGVGAAGMAVAAHGLFGLLTARVYAVSNLLAALFVTYLVHTAWNWFILYYSKQTSLTRE